MTDTSTQGIIELNISGMSCAACAGRVERALGKLDGVTATVNYATERATVIGLDTHGSATAVAAVTKAGYGAEVRTDEDDEWTRRSTTARLGGLRRRMLVAALLTVPLMDLSLILALVPGLRFPLWEWVCVLLAVPIVTWAAWPFHKTALRNLRYGAVTMDTLVSLGVVVSFGWALYAIATGSSSGGYWIGFGETPPGADAIYLDVAAGLTTFQLAGRYFETRSRRKAGEVLESLGDLAPSSARRIDDDGSETVVPVSELRIGDRVVVLPGETIPVDGRVLAGHAAIDERAMTGEPKPREAGPDADVTSGSIATDGRLEMRTTATGQRTRLAQLAALAERAQEGKARFQKLVDRIVTVFVPAIIALAVLTTIGWLIGGASTAHAVSVGIAVLIIGCPCALGLATPTALLVGVGRGARLGILIKGQDALEASGAIDTVVLDKTGTLTTGEMAITRIRTFDVWDEEDVLALAAGLEQHSAHPIAAAIRGEAKRRGLAPVHVDEARTAVGRGLSGTAGGVPVAVGSPRLAAERGTLDEQATNSIEQIELDGDTAVVLERDSRTVAVLGLGDRLHPSAIDGVAALRTLGLKTVLLTGDSHRAARRVAEQVGVDEVRSEVLPEQKAATIAELQDAGARVAMVGDGINDSAALATAQLGLAVIDGTDLAIRSADVILIREDLRVIAEALSLAKATLATIRGNLIWAFVYNLAAIPLAAAGLLNPLIAAAAMSLSSVLVVANSLRLQRRKL